MLLFQWREIVTQSNRIEKEVIQYMDFCQLEQDRCISLHGFFGTDCGLIKKDSGLKTHKCRFFFTWPHDNRKYQKQKC